MVRAIVCMGVSGTGKSSIAQAVAVRLNFEYHDADSYHSDANKAKMKSGTPLNDEDRAPWLAALHDLLESTFQEGNTGVVLACSALKRRYRDTLRGARRYPDIIFVHLRGTKELIRRRMIERQEKEGHYMPPSLLDSQLAALELPTPDENVLSIDIDAAIEDIVETVVANTKDHAS